MIGHFPPIYPGEALYSWLARYHEQSGNVSPKRTMSELFNNTSMVAVLDLPTNILDLYQAISHFNPPEIDSLVRQHTLYNYYAHFQSKEIGDSALKYMLNRGNPGAIHLSFGITASPIKQWKYIRFCLSCKKEDLAKYGESYWHISHQLPKVYYCYIHNEWLLSSKIEVRSYSKHRYFSMSNNGLKIQKFNSPPLLSESKDKLEIIAEESLKLINLNSKVDISQLQKSYRYLLQINGYASYTGKVDQRKLAKQFNSYYGEELLSLMDSNVDINNNSCWLKAITRKHRKAFHPIRHILFVNFFGLSVEKLSTMNNKIYTPFGKMPYYCLNPIANHYKQRVVTDLEITACTDTRSPVGTFKCDCGFIYSRRGPDKDDSDKYNIGRIKQFGHVWEFELNKLLKTGTSYYSIAKQMKCDVSTVKKYALASKLNKDKPIPLLTLKIEKEKQWLWLIDQNKVLNITGIRKLNPSLYMWHYRNNREWLKANSPITVRRTLAKSRVDWKERDQKILFKIKYIVPTLYKLEKKPVFVNKSRIGKEIGELSLIEKSLEKMPLTKKYIETMVETREMFQIRRIKWACSVLAKEGSVIIQEWKVRRLASLKEDMSEEVEKALQSELGKYQEKS